MIWIRQLRIHQWVKNLLLFVPVLASFQLLSLDTKEAIGVFMAFGAFSLVSSAVYISNDLLDIEHDRAHAIKRHRPIASGQISRTSGLIVAIFAFVLGLSFGYFVGRTFFVALLAYLLLTFVYSILLKRMTLVDCIALAALYTIRVVAGSLATEISLSFWLLAFSVFFFLALAFVKRYAELEATQKSGQIDVPGRGYSVHDMPLILVFGVSSAFLGVLIFALYLDSSAIRSQYAFPEIGWLAIPFLLYLIGRMWFKAHRGQMNQDPVIFLLRDVPSILTVLMIGISLLSAHIGFTL